MINLKIIIIILLIVSPSSTFVSALPVSYNLEISDQLGSFADVNAIEFKKLIDSNKYILLDVRTANEFNAGHLAGAINIDWYGSDFELKVQKLDKSKQVLIYCRSGNRTGKTKYTMLGMGFKSVVNLEKGIIEWAQSGYGFVKKKI